MTGRRTGSTGRVDEKGPGLARSQRDAASCLQPSSRMTNLGTGMDSKQAGHIDKKDIQRDTSRQASQLDLH